MRILRTDKQDTKNQGTDGEARLRGFGVSMHSFIEKLLFMLSDCRHEKSILHADSNLHALEILLSVKTAK
jgi:hypothetical protein